MSETQEPKPLGRWGLLEPWQQLVAAVVGSLLLLAVTAGLVTQWFGDTAARGPDDRGAKDVCETFVERRLKAPATAEFTSVTVMRGGGEWVVEGDVDSENGFGALIRSEFACTVRPADEAGTNWDLVDLQLAE